MVGSTHGHGSLRRYRLTALVIALALTAVACGGNGASTETVTTTPTVPAATTDPTSYVAEMDRLFADLLNEESRYDSVYNEEFWAGRSDDQLGEGEAELTQDEQLEYLRGYITGIGEINIEHVDLLALVSPPIGFVDAHDAYVSARRNLGDALTAEFDAFITALTDPATELPPQIAQLELVQEQACTDLKDVVAQAGYSLDIGCGTPP